MVMQEYTIRKIGSASRQYFNISPNNSACPQKALNIEIGTGLINEYEFTGSDDYTSHGKTIYGVLGIVHIFPISYLCVIADYNREKLLRVRGKEIYEISRVELISISGEDKEANKPLKDGIKKLLSTGFYFSFTYDLTRRIQREKGDDRYWWNKNLYEDFKTYNVSSSWAIKIIQGYVAYSKILVNAQSMELTLISRRRFAMAGTRFAKRGIDDQGNVANFVETEQILKFGEYLLSFVQIRGSVPAFWEQKGITADLQLTRNLQMDQWAFEKHFQDMLSEYDKLVWANLLNNKRSYEMKLIQRFEELVKLYKGSNNRYLYFNFHQECTKDNYKAMDEKLKLGNCSNYLGFYISKGGNVLKKQIGVLRSNCLDCLDRTNVCQAYYAFKAFVHQLNFFRKQGLLEQEAIESVENNVVGDGEFLMYLISLDNPTAKELSNWMRAIRTMWAYNGDDISKQYSGTGSTFTEVTINNKTSIKGKITHKMTSIERFFKNNINSKDDWRQECIDLFTGQHKRSKSVAGHEIETTLHEQQHIYSDIRPYTLWVFTWNLAGNEPRYEMDFTQVLKSEEFYAAPDIVVIGFQETIVLNAYNCLKGHDKSRIEALKSYAMDALDDIDPNYSYTFFAECAMVGLLSMCFWKTEVLDKISDVHSVKVKTGFGGNIGNKGAVVTRFSLEDTSIIVWWAHLESGQKKETERLQQIKDIVSQTFIEKGSKYKFTNHDVKIFFGDLNFRINLPYYSVITTIDNITDSNREEQLELLLNNDQLIQCKADYEWLYCFKEMPIRFLPTYKYDKNSYNYDTSKKLRIPSWTDRVLWYHDESKSKGKETQYIKPLLYERRESIFSDHRPVAAYFEVQSHKHNIERKTSFKKKVVDKKSTSFIVKKPHYDPLESEIKKEFNDFDVFDLPKDISDEHIQLDLDFNNIAKNNEEVKHAVMGDDDIDDLLDFDNDNLIDIKGKDKDNLIDFGPPNAQKVVNPGHRFSHHPPVHSHSMGVVRGGPMAGLPHHAMYSNVPFHTPPPMLFNTVSAPNYNRSSVPRKPNPDPLHKAQSTKPPAVKTMATEDFFKF